MLIGLLGSKKVCTNKVVAYKHNRVQESKNPLLNQSKPLTKQQSLQPYSATFKGQKRQFQRINRLQQSDTKRDTIKNKQKKRDHYHQKNLNLSDYLKLTSLNRKISRNKEYSQRFHSEPKQTYMNDLYAKKTPIVDNKRGIILIHKQTEKQLQTVQKQFHSLIKQIYESKQIGQDQQSLVFLCNIFNIFEERISTSVKLTKQLIDEQKRKKDIKNLKKYGQSKIDTSKLKKYPKNKDIPNKFFQSAALISR